MLTDDNKWERLAGIIRYEFCLLEAEDDVPELFKLFEKQIEKESESGY